MALVRNNLPDQLMSWGRTVTSRAGPEVVRLVRSDRRVPIGETRELVGSIAVGGPIGGGTLTGVRIVATAPQALWTDQGTHPHRIVPVRARVLRFSSGGSVVFARRVSHPGNRAQNWWEPTLAAAWSTALARAAASTPLPAA